MRFISTLILIVLSGFIHGHSLPIDLCNKNSALSRQSGILPPDLAVTKISFISLTFNNTAKTYSVKVIVSIKNKGQVKSPETQLEAYTKTQAGGGSWKIMGSLGSVPAIEPAKEQTIEYEFKENVFAVGTTSFDFRVKVDARNLIAEPNEVNNYSDTIIVNPRAY